MIQKEVRALLPAWTACAIAILASRWNVEPFEYLGVPAYLIGTAALGAWMMGHEYAHGTVASMLTLPVPRRRVWLSKLAVAAPMLATLAVLGTFSTRLESGDRILGSALFVLPPVVSLFVAPWLTMLTRSPLAGAVFAFSAIGGSLSLGEWIGVQQYGYTNQVDAFRVEFLWSSLITLTVVAAIMGWRTFATLEAVDGPGADIELAFVPPRSDAAAVTRRHPIVTLIAKELRLQQLAIVIAALWAAAYSIAEAFGTRAMTRDVNINVVSVLSAFYSVVLPVVIGSLACAEERHFGTLDSQLLLPVRCSTQWIVKTATALVLAVGLALLLPIALARAFGDFAAIAGPARNHLTPESAIVVLGLTSISLYVSTLAGSGLRALIGSIAAVVAFGSVVAKALQSGLGSRVFLMMHSARVAYGHADPRIFTSVHTYYLGPFAASAVLAVMLVLALPHYRYAARRPALVAAHAAIVLGCVVAYDILMNVIVAFRK